MLGRRLELTGARADGSEFPIEIVVWATRDNHEWAFHAFIHDITERRRAEEALRQAYAAEQATVARLKELDAAKDAFIATISHELRTPLTTVSGYLDLLGEGEVEPAQHSRMLQAMTRNTARLQNLVEDLLVRAIGALVSNAVKYSPIDTSITVHAAAAGDQVTIAVTDHGVGIAAEELERVFERFYRTAYAYDNAIQGVGLGLWLVKTIAEVHGGTVTAISTPGQGSTFTLRLSVGGR
ncbi:PAS domain-containing sensor histidine kinase [Planobispora longispora]|uniref:PAS domain-containing sensor histidine kinase n=1 Tax=Planobispora longispora TaxID=28887 RepID=UPI0019434867|nr:ATP-binding protein [Planobispora longispora]